MALEIDAGRCRRIRTFFLKVLLKSLWWDVMVRRPILKRFRPDPTARWQETARQFRSLAVEMGGVMIKLGQFLSIRVDILPLEITSVLADLQDEVPPAPFDEIAGRIEADFGRPVAEVFAWISPDPSGAASLAQVHPVRLKTGERAVAKVLRPGIETLVETDLAAIRSALAWLKWYAPVRRRVDLDWLYDEFSTVTRQELDFTAEGKNAERLAMEFRDDRGVYTPKIYWSCSGPKVLTLEDVGFLKISDADKLAQAGIPPARVADRLYNLYMRQVFETHFVHVDPHPGNLFVRPLPTREEMAEGRRAFDPGETVPRAEDRPFQIVFVDFGMMAEIPERLQSALRDYAIGLGTRNARQIVSAYRKAGTLLPDADLKRLEEVHEALLDRFWGVRAGSLQEAALREARYFIREYGDVIRAAPFQFQADMLFVVRAIGILSGMAAHLDPAFDVWSKTIPYARKYAASALQSDAPSLTDALIAFGRAFGRLPAEAEDLIRQLRRGDATVRTAPTTEARRLSLGVRRAVDRLGGRVLAAGLLVSGSILFGSEGGVRIGKIFMITGVFVALLTLRRR